MVPKLRKYPGTTIQMLREAISVCEEHGQLCQLQEQMCSYAHQMQWF